MVIFTPEELSEFTLDQLRILAKYYKVPYNKNIKKEVLVDRLVDILYQPEAGRQAIVMADGTEKAYSVRVKRIYDRNKENLA